MLGESNVVVTIAVKNLDNAKQYYGQTLGLKHEGENPAGVMYRSGTGQLFVYRSDTAGSGQATCASWSVRDIVSVVSGLSKKGVKFEHYDIPDAKVEGDIYVIGSMKAAWFKDPDGNILALNNSA